MSDDSEPTHTIPGDAYYDEFEYDTAETGEIRLTWWDRWKLRRQLKREERAERRARRYVKRQQRKWERREAKRDRQALKQHKRIEKQKREWPGHFAANQELCNIATGRTAADYPEQVRAAEVLFVSLSRMRDRRFRYVALLGSWIVVLLIAMLTMCSCGNALPPIKQPEHAQPRMVLEQERATVRIKTYCGVGSGVLVAPDEVLTAWHVVTCTVKDYKGLPVKRRAPKLVIDTKDADGDTTYTGAVIAADVPRDLARVKLSAPVALFIEPPTYAHARESDEERTCIAHAEPEFGRTCGYVEDTDYPDPRTAITFSTPVWFGNSGSGVYDADGNLVGIVTAMRWCDKAAQALWELFRLPPMYHCGGYAAHLAGSAVMP